MDIRGYRQALDRYGEAYRYDRLDEDTETLRKLGKGFEEFEDFLCRIDTEVERVFGELEESGRKRGIPDGEAPDGEKGPLPDRKRDDGGPDMDILNDPDIRRMPDPDGEDERPDEADRQRKKEQESVRVAHSEVEEALAEVDEALALEVEGGKTLKESTEQWRRCVRRMDESPATPGELEVRRNRLAGELETCREVQQAAGREMDRWRDIEEFRGEDTIRDLVVMAAELRKQHRLALFPRQIIRKMRALQGAFHELSREARPRLEKSQGVYRRARAAVEAKERELAILEERLEEEEQRWKDHGEAGEELWEKMQALYRELREVVGPGQPVPATRGKRNGRLELTFEREETVLRGVREKRVERVRRCRERCRAMETLHPPMAELTEETLNRTHVFPDHVRVGTTRWSHSGPGVELEIPELVEFPGKGPLLVPGADWMAPLLLRLAWAMPQGQLEIVALDQERAGQNILPVNDLSDVPGLLKVVTGPDELQDALAALESHMGTLAKRYFKQGISDWASYNARHPIHALPCKVLAVCSLTGFDTWMSLGGQLKRILENGARHGIFTILCEDALNAAETRTKDVLKGVDFRRMGASDPTRYRRLKGEGEAPEMPAGAWSLMAGIVEAAKKRAERPTKGFGELFADTPMWSGRSADGLSAVIGWDETGRPVRFKLDTGGEGGAGVHVLVGGQTGSGKTGMLHALIHSLAHVYGPDELQLYLFDFKDGVGVRRYADEEGRVWLPHARTVAIQNDPRYALELFRHLREVVFEERSRKFKAMGGGVEKIGDYVKRGGKMPRLVVIIDEFQELFVEYGGENVGDQITAELTGILKKGRSMGVHLVLATQTMATAHRMMRGSADDVMQQIGVRLALWGTGEEGILASNNRMAVTEITPKRQCILNAKTGLAGGNTVFDFPFAEPDSEASRAYRARIAEGCRRKGVSCDGHLYDGAKLPTPPTGAALRTELAKATEGVHFAMALGVLPDFAATPMTVGFDNLAGEHLLVGGEDEGELAGGLLPANVWAGLRASVLRSLAATADCDVLYYNPGAATVPAGLPSRFLRATSRAGEMELLTTFRRLGSSRARRKVVFVENFDKATLLHPQEPQPSVPLFGGKTAAPPKATARSLFLKAFTGTGVPPFNVILFTKNVMISCRNILGKMRTEANILEACYKRMAFNVTGDTLKAMIPEAAYGQQHGPRRIWYEDRKTGNVRAVVPYAEK